MPTHQMSESRGTPATTSVTRSASVVSLIPSILT